MLLNVLSFLSTLTIHMETYLKSFSSKAWRAVIAFTIKLQFGNLSALNNHHKFI